LQYYNILADGGYRGELAKHGKEMYGYVINEVMRTDNDQIDFKPVNKRWIIERSFYWFDNDRRLCRNHELLAEFSETMVKSTAIKLILNKI